jgi:hypothetical protein
MVSLVQLPDQRAVWGARGFKSNQCAGITPKNRRRELEWGHRLATKSGDYCPDAGDLGILSIVANHMKEDATPASMMGRRSLTLVNS